jgi:hypothetical protein
MVKTSTATMAYNYCTYGNNESVTNNCPQTTNINWNSPKHNMMNDHPKQYSG